MGHIKEWGGTHHLRQFPISDGHAESTVLHAAHRETATNQGEEHHLPRYQEDP